MTVEDKSKVMIVGDEVTDESEKVTIQEIRMVKKILKFIRSKKLNVDDQLKIERYLYDLLL